MLVLVVDGLRLELAGVVVGLDAVLDGFEAKGGVEEAVEAALDADSEEDLVGLQDFLLGLVGLAGGGVDGGDGDLDARAALVDGGGEGGGADLHAVLAEDAVHGLGDVPLILDREGCRGPSFR